MHPLLKSETLQISRIGYGGSIRRGGFSFTNATPTQVYRFIGTPSEFLRMVESLAEKHPALSRNLKSRTGEWSGLGAENGLQAVKQGFSSAALEAFQKETAALGPQKARGQPMLSPQGSAFSMGRVMQGHPIAAFHRPKCKLPPVNLDLTVNAWCGREAADIQRALAKIARAAWDYQANGGPVSLTVHYLYAFREPRAGHHAAMISLKIPLSNGAQFATGASLQLFRGIGIPLCANLLSGKTGDGLPLALWDNPASLPLSGEPAEDSAILARLQIK